MAEGNWSVIRVEKISAEGAQKTERHNERKNESYANLNVDTERIARNVHFKDTGGLTYNEYFQRLIDEGKISTRGQKAGLSLPPAHRGNPHRPKRNPVVETLQGRSSERNCQGGHQPKEKQWLCRKQMLPD